MSFGKGVETPKQLYKFLLKTIKQLPEGTQDYYRRFVRQQFNSYTDENDSERIQEILKKSITDAEWIVKKYKVKENSS